MRRTVDFAAVFTLVATMALAGCSPTPTLPGEPAADAFFSRPPAPGFDALERKAPLPVELTASRTIGPEGGQIRLADAGLRFVVPPGALAEDTRISVRALAGAALAFEFEPHGLEFSTPASIHVDIAGTKAEAFQLDGAPRRPLDRFLGVYFTGDERSGFEPRENLATYLLDGAIVFDIEHFSGYVCASG